jgi:negative regulator of flagellin synthesis FlgM
MSNRIDSPNYGISDKTDNYKVPDSGRGLAVQSDQSSGTSKAAGADNPVRDTVVLTERSQLLQHLEKTAAELPVVDQGRVDAVKADIANGNYQIDVDNIAEILLRIEKDFGDS